METETVMTSPQIAVVLLNWNNRGDTLESLETVFNTDYPNFEVIKADNSSRSGSVAATLEAFPQTHLIESGSNPGYVWRDSLRNAS